MKTALEAQFREFSKFRRRLAKQTKTAKRQRLGSAGPASECRLVDPATGLIVGVLLRGAGSARGAGRATGISITLPTPATRQRAAARDRQRLHRQRHDQDRELLKVQPRTRIIEALMMGDPPRLTEAQAADQAAVERAVTDLLDDYAERWIVSQCDRRGF